MKLSPIHLGKVCPYCNNKTHKVNSKVVYGTDYGAIRICYDCDAHLGCHKSGKAKGSVAKEGLRKLRTTTHSWFDPLWKKKMLRTGLPKHKCRNDAYEWLAKELGIHRDICHVGMFNEQQCKRAIYICSLYYPK